MMFCQKCGGILIPSKTGKRLICGKCGTAAKKKGSLSIKEQVNDGKRKIEIIDKQVNTLPKTNEECPKCNNKEAYFWTMQTRAVDEPETQFFECTKCKHRWRAYN